MALPKSVESPQLRRLHDLVDAAGDAGWTTWPELKDTDYTRFGKIVVLFSYIDVSLRRIAEAADHAGVLKPPWASRARKLNMTEVEDAVRSLPDWSEPNYTALNQITERRGFRNLIAHFGVRRFPTDDAFFFFTKSERDFKRVHGFDPEPGVLMTAVMEAIQVSDGLKHINKLQQWIARAAAEAERIL